MDQSLKISLKTWIESYVAGRKNIGGQARIIFHGAVVILVVSHCKTKERDRECSTHTKHEAATGMHLKQIL